MVSNVFGERFYCRAASVTVLVEIALHSLFLSRNIYLCLYVAYFLICFYAALTTLPLATDSRGCHHGGRAQTPPLPKNHVTPHSQSSSLLRLSRAPALTKDKGGTRFSLSLGSEVRCKTSAFNVVTRHIF